MLFLLASYIIAGSFFCNRLTRLSTVFYNCIAQELSGLNTSVFANCGGRVARVRLRKTSYLNKRLLKLQVGHLLTEGPGYSREIPLHLPQRVHVDDELYLESLVGNLILTRTKEGILVQGTLQVQHQRECDRCLDEYAHDFDMPVAELFASPADPEKSAFSVDSNGDIDLALLLREEVIIEGSYRAICRDECRGLSSESGINLNYEVESAVTESQNLGSYADIDPRLEVLKQLLDQ